MDPGLCRRDPRFPRCTTETEEMDMLHSEVLSLLLLFIYWSVYLELDEAAVSTASPAPTFLIPSSTHNSLQQQMAPAHPPNPWST